MKLVHLLLLFFLSSLLSFSFFPSPLSPLFLFPPLAENYIPQLLRREVPVVLCRMRDFNRVPRARMILIGPFFFSVLFMYSETCLKRTLP